MDIISRCPDDLLLRILSFIPTKYVVATSLLSKRWKSLWILIPRLEYDCRIHYNRFTQLVYRTLLENKAPVLDKLSLKNLSLGPECSAVDVGLWIDNAVSRVRELEITIQYSVEGPFSLPSSLYACQTLVSFTFTIKGCSLVDVPSAVCLPSLKILHLRCIGWAHTASILRLISGCPNLEELLVSRPDDGGDYMIHKEGHTLDYSLSMVSSVRWYFFERMFGKEHSRNMINLPSLKSFCIITENTIFDSRRIEKRPDLVMARIASSKGVVTNKSLETLTRVRRFYLCLLPSEVLHPNSEMFFPRLVNLKICTCTQGWWNLLTRMLQDSPNLRFLTLTNEHCRASVLARLDVPNSWMRPSCVPACLLSSLRCFKWIGYTGRQGDKEVATYVMRNATGLKKTIFSSLFTDFYTKFRMLKELASVPMPSPSCQLLFD